MKQEKVRTMLRLTPDTIGLLHYYVREGISPTINEVIETIIANYTKAYADINGESLNTIMYDARYMFDMTRIPKKQNNKKQAEVYAAAVTTPEQIEADHQRSEAQKNKDHQARLRRIRVNDTEEYKVYVGLDWINKHKPSNKEMDVGFGLWRAAGKPNLRAENKYLPMTMEEAKTVEEEIYKMSDKAFAYYQEICGGSQEQWAIDGKPHPTAKNSEEAERYQLVPTWYNKMIEDKAKKEQTQEAKNEAKLRAELGDKTYERLYGN